MMLFQQTVQTTALQNPSTEQHPGGVRVMTVPTDAMPLTLNHVVRLILQRWSLVDHWLPVAYLPLGQIGHGPSFGKKQFFLT